MKVSLWWPLHAEQNKRAKPCADCRKISNGSCNFESREEVFLQCEMRPAKYQLKQTQAALVREHLEILRVGRNQFKSGGWNAVFPHFYGVFERFQVLHEIFGNVDLVPS